MAHYGTNSTGDVLPKGGKKPRKPAATPKPASTPKPPATPVKRPAAKGKG